MRLSFSDLGTVSRKRADRPPHNHATWAASVGIQGEERNWRFERTDDGSVPGRENETPAYRRQV
jgi:hypothetical protein